MQILKAGEIGTLNKDRIFFNPEMIKTGRRAFLTPWAVSQSVVENKLALLSKQSGPN